MNTQSYSSSSLVSCIRLPRLLSTMLLYIVFGTTGFSQVDSSLSYYPLEVGNRWTYFVFGGYSAAEFIDVLVVDDTLFSNGKMYFKIASRSKQDTSFYFERVDSTTSTVFHIEPPYTSDEKCFDSLRAMPGDKPQTNRLNTSRVFCDSIVTGIILGFHTNVKYFSARVIPTFPVYALAQGLGLVYQAFLEEDPVYPRYSSRTTTLVYAQIHGVPYGVPVFVAPDVNFVPQDLFLGQNYPNPFNSQTRIPIKLRRGIQATLTLWNVLGQKVREYALLPTLSGRSDLLLNADGLTTGVYIYTLVSQGRSLSKTLLYLK